MTANHQPDRSLAPGIIPEPVHVDGDRGTLTPANGKTADAHAERRSLARIALAKMMSAIHGDKYMVGAYPAAVREQAAAPDEVGPREKKR